MNDADVRKEDNSIKCIKTVPFDISIHPKPFIRNGLTRQIC